LTETGTDICKQAKRTNILYMNITPWFDRSFSFPIAIDQFPFLLQRLQCTALRVQALTQYLPEWQLNLKPDGKWSIKEHIGHMLIMEPLWQHRFKDLINKHTTMTPADLNNTATHEARFNQYNISRIINQFKQQRLKTLHLLAKLETSAFEYTLLHPRLHLPMRITDLMYFVAEHDDHHINTIKQFKNS